MNYIQATIRVGILLLAGAVDVPALGQLPFAPAPLRTDLLQPPTDAGAWGGTGASLPDGSIAIGDLALNRVTLQAVDGTVLQTLVDPTAAKGQDRSFGAAVALLGTDELLVFARAGSTPASGPAVHRFRQSKPGASWQHVGVVQLAGVPATATAARNLSRLVTSPDSRQFVAVWEHGSAVAWSVCEDIPGFGWFEQPLGFLQPVSVGTLPDYAPAIRAGVIAVVRRTSTDSSIRFARFDQATQGWFAPYDGSVSLGGIGSPPAITSQGRVCVAVRSSPSASTACQLAEFTYWWPPATFVRTQSILLDAPNLTLPRIGVGLGSHDDSVFVLSRSFADGTAWVDEIDEELSLGFVRRRTFRAEVPATTASSSTWWIGVVGGTLSVLPTPVPTLPVQQPLRLSIESVADLDRDGTNDRDQLGAGAAVDCNANGIPDAGDLLLGIGTDVDGDGRLDACSADCDGDGATDFAELLAGATDCNRNGVPDEPCDLQNPLLDVDGNGRLDACGADCDRNGIPDEIELFNGSVADCDANGIPDGCQGYLAPDMQGDGSGGFTAVRWQRVSAESPVINALEFRSTSTFATARRVMIVLDRSGTGNRTSVTDGDIVHFVRLPSIVCPRLPDGTVQSVTVPLPAIDLSGAPAFWVAVENVTLAYGDPAPAAGESGHYVHTTFPTVVNGAAWFSGFYGSAALTNRQPTFSIRSVPCIPVGDFNLDGTVGGVDLGMLLGAWGQADPLFDLDRNGIVAGGDLLILLSSWSDR